MRKEIARGKWKKEGGKGCIIGLLVWDSLFAKIIIVIKVFTI